MKKKRFSPIERYTVWKIHKERCGFCAEPIRFKDVTIDHFFPEKLLEQYEDRKQLLFQYGIDDREFNINGFGNWLPCHSACNQKKGTTNPRFSAGHQLIVDRLIRESAKAERFKTQWSKDKKKDKILATLLSGLELEAITLNELISFLEPLYNTEELQILPNDIIMLSGGYWVYKDEIAKEGYCNCERKICCDSETKMYCYFKPDLSEWVITKGLYSKCYNEEIECPRCKRRHKRGHIGRSKACGHPFSNQALQKDD